MQGPRIGRAKIISMAIDASHDGADLVAWSDRRDEAAFRRVVDRHGGMVRAVAARVCGARDADDVVQAAFLILLRHARRLRSSPDVGGWLHVVAVRLALRAQRQARRKRHVALGETMDPGPAHDQGRLSELLDAALVRLGERERGAIVLHHLEGLSHAEIAVRCGVAEGTVASWLSRGRERLRVLLARQGLTFAGAGLVAALAALPRPAASAACADTIIAAATAGPGPGAAALVAHERTIAMLLPISAALATIAMAAAVAVAPLIAEPPANQPAAVIAPGPVELGDNAALGYLTACLTALEARAGKTPLHEVTDPQEVGRALDQLVRSSRLERYDSGIRFHGDGAGTLLPHVDQLRQLGRLLVVRGTGRCQRWAELRQEADRLEALSAAELASLSAADRADLAARPPAARRAQAEEEIDAAAADLVAALRLGCHLGAPGSTIIESLVGQRIIDAAASGIITGQGVLAASRTDLLAAVQRLPVRGAPARLIADDIRHLGLLELTRLRTMPIERRHITIAATDAGAQRPSDAEIDRAIGILRARVAGLDAAAGEQVPGKELLAPSGDRLVDLFLPASAQLLERDAETRIRIALLRLALSVPVGDLPADAGERFALAEPRREADIRGLSAFDPLSGKRVVLPAPRSGRAPAKGAGARDPGRAAADADF